MGNCPACLSISKPLRFSLADHNTENADHLTSRSAASRVHASDLHKPVLKPCILSTNNQLEGQLHHLKGGTQKLVAPAANRKTTGDHLKPIKKVRFAEEIMLILASDHRKGDPPVSCQANEGDNSKEMYHKNQTQSGLLTTPASILTDQSSNIEVKQSSIMRVKVIVTKKEISALLQTKEGKNSSIDALMLESILSPLLKDLDKTQAVNADVAPDPPVKKIDLTPVKGIRG